LDIALIYACLGLMVVGVAFIHRLGFGIRVSVLLGITYLAAMFELFIFGVGGEGRLFLVGCALLGALLLRLHISLALLAFILLSLCAYYLGLTSEWIAAPTIIRNPLVDPETFVAKGVAFVMICGVSVAALLSLINRRVHESQLLALEYPHDRFTYSETKD